MIKKDDLWDVDDDDDHSIQYLGWMNKSQNKNE